MGYLLVPLIVLGVLVVLMGSVVVLGRVRGGRYLRPVITTLTWGGRARRAVSTSSRATKP